MRGEHVIVELAAEQLWQGLGAPEKVDVYDFVNLDVGVLPVMVPQLLGRRVIDVPDVSVTLPLGHERRTQWPDFEADLLRDIDAIQERVAPGPTVGRWIPKLVYLPSNFSDQAHQCESFSGRFQNAYVAL